MSRHHYFISCGECGKDGEFDSGICAECNITHGYDVRALRPTNSPGVAHVFSDECRCGDCGKGGERDGR